MKVVFSNLSGVLRQRLLGAFGSFAAIFLLVLSGIQPAEAQTLGDVFCSAAVNVSPFIDVFNWFSYIAGGFIIINGLLHLRNHHEDPRQHPHHKTFAMFTAGALLTALPSFIDMLSLTLFGGASNGYDPGTGLCSPGQAGGTAAASLDGMFTNFVQNIQGPLTALVFIVAMTMGTFLIVRGLLKAAKYGTDPRTHSMTHILANLIIGAILLTVGDSIGTIMSSVMGTTGGNGGIMQFSAVKWTAIDQLGGDTTHFKVAIQAALTFFQLVGLISFVRGWNVIRNAVEGVGQATFAQGLTHIIGGVLAMNIYLFMEIVDKTFGTQFIA